MASAILMQKSQKSMGTAREGEFRRNTRVQVAICVAVLT